MTTRPCLNCGALTTRRTSRCSRCDRQHQAQRNARRTWYQGDWAKRSKQARDAWVAEHGWVCPGLPPDPPHPATDLELDHTTGQVLCHRHNVAAGPAGHTT